MLDSDLSVWTPLVKRAARDIAVPGLLSEDVEQECWLAVVRASKRLRAPTDKPARGFVKAAINNHCQKLRDRALAAKRTPLDARGRAWNAWVPWDVATITAKRDAAPVADSHFGATAARLQLGGLQARLPAADWALLVNTFAEAGTLALTGGNRDNKRLAAARLRAQYLLVPVNGETHVSTQRISLPVVPAEELPECHAQGADPEGYSHLEDECWHCKDKFSCAQHTEDFKGEDQEVVAVLAGAITYEQALGRMAERRSYQTRGEPVPDALSIATVVAVESEAKAAAVKAKPKKAKPKPVKAAAVKAKPKKAKAVKAAAKSAKAKPKKAAKPTKAKKAAKRAKPAKTETTRLGRVRDPERPLPGDKPLPKPRTVPIDVMARRMSGTDGRYGVRIGQPFDLEIGQQIVRVKRDGSEVVVTLCADGFEYAGNKYASLSSCCIVAERRIVSGNDFFHLNKHSRTMIRDAEGVVIAT